MSRANGLLFTWFVGFVFAFAAAGCGAPGPSCGAVAGGPARRPLRSPESPATGSDDSLTGRVLRVTPDDHHVTVYTFDGGGWRVKPSFESPETRMNPEGTFSAATATGGIDEQATLVIAFPLPGVNAFPLLGGAVALHDALYSAALATVAVIRRTGGCAAGPPAALRGFPVTRPGSQSILSSAGRSQVWGNRRRGSRS
jgi:hypothetical protein